MFYFCLFIILTFRPSVAQMSISELITVFCLQSKGRMKVKCRHVYSTACALGKEVEVVPARARIYTHRTIRKYTHRVFCTDYSYFSTYHGCEIELFKVFLLTADALQVVGSDSVTSQHNLPIFSEPAQHLCNTENPLAASDSSQTALSVYKKWSY